MAKTVTAKKTCCDSSPRCSTCPVVWRRLEADGLAERVGKRTWQPTRGKIPKAIMAAMRR